MKLEIVAEEGVPEARRLALVCYGASAEPESWWRWWLFGRGEGSSRIAMAWDSGQVVGMQPVSFFPFAFSGAGGMCALLTGGMIAPGYRGRGLFRRLVDAAVEEAWRRDCQFALTMPNERSAPAFARFGWTDLGERSAMVWLGRTHGSSAGRTTENQIMSGEGLSEGNIASLAAAADSSRGMAIARNSDWLRWRFRGNPLSDYVVARDPEEDGAVATLAVGTTRVLRGARVGFLVDLLGKGGAPRSRAARALARELRRQGALFVASVVGGRSTRSELNGAGFRGVPRPIVPRRFRTVCLEREGGRGPAPINLDEWAMTLADWDGI